MQSFCSLSSVKGHAISPGTKEERGRNYGYYAIFSSKVGLIKNESAGSRDQGGEKVEKEVMRPRMERGSLKRRRRKSRALVDTFGERGNESTAFFNNVLSSEEREVLLPFQASLSSSLYLCSRGEASLCCTEAINQKVGTFLLFLLWYD